MKDRISLVLRGPGPLVERDETMFQELGRLEGARPANGAGEVHVLISAPASVPLGRLEQTLSLTGYVPVIIGDTAMRGAEESHLSPVSIRGGQAREVLGHLGAHECARVINERRYMPRSEGHRTPEQIAAIWAARTSEGSLNRAATDAALESLEVEGGQFNKQRALEHALSFDY